MQALDADKDSSGVERVYMSTQGGGGGGGGGDGGRTRSRVRNYC